MARNMLVATDIANMDSAAVNDVHTAHVSRPSRLLHIRGHLRFPLSPLTYDVLSGSARKCDATNFRRRRSQ